ncbi:hypothetical protein [Rheinheimera tilapiae]|uniref:Uncharacterized protein n=1 Tax=Rheinheimera tilapiae TaxID=875043 RepID=A0ABV6B892_9GAMM
MSGYVCDALSEAQIRQRFDSRLQPWTVQHPDMMAPTIQRQDNAETIGVIGLRSDWFNKKALAILCWNTLVYCQPRSWRSFRYARFRRLSFYLCLFCLRPRCGDPRDPNISPATIESAVAARAFPCGRTNTVVAGLAANDGRPLNAAYCHCGLSPAFRYKISFSGTSTG